MHSGRVILNAVKCAQTQIKFTASINGFVRNMVACRLSERNKRYDYRNDSESTSKRRKTHFLLGVSFTFFNLFSFGEEEEEKESELVTTIKRSVLLTQRGEYNKAEQMMHIALRQAQTLQHYDAITYIYDLMANLAFDRQEYKKAETLFVSVLQRLMSKGTTDDDLRVIHISLKMAKLYQHMGDAQKAETGYQYCLQKLNNHRAQGVENEDVLLLLAMTSDWYAKMLLSQSKYTDAFKYCLQAYNLCMTVNGEEHEQTVILLNDLGTISSMRGEYDKAIEYLSMAVKLGKKLPDMENIGLIHVNLGKLQMEKGLYEEAKKSCREGWRLSKEQKDNESFQAASECLNEVKKLMS